MNTKYLWIPFALPFAGILIIVMFKFGKVGVEWFRTSFYKGGVELYATPLYDDPHLLAYYRLEDDTDSKGRYPLSDEAADGTPTFQISKFNNGSDSGSKWQTNIGRYNSRFVLSTGTMPMSISAWVSINSQPPYGLDGDFVEIPITNGTVDYALGYGWFDGIKQIFFSRSRLGTIADRAMHPFTMVPGIFYHLVGMWDGADNLILYLNGVYATSHIKVSTGDGSASDAVGLGINGTWSNQGTIQGGVGGRVDDVAIFDRVLTPADIRLLESRTD